MSYKYPWWKFWNPKSGEVGGMILGAVMAVTLILIFSAVS